MAVRIPNPRAEVRFLADLPRGCAEGRAPALQAGSPGAVPGDSTNSAVVAPRRSNRSVRDRARFDSVRRLRVDAALRCPSPVQRSARPPTNAGILEARGRSSKPCRASSTLAVRSHAGEAARCGSALPMRSRRVRFSSPAPGRCRLPLCARRSRAATAHQPGALFREQHGLQNRGARFNSAARLECFRPRPGPASSKRRAARSTRAGSATSHSSSGPGRWTLNPATRVRFPHATPHLHPRWAAGLRSQLGRFDSSWRYRSLFVVGRSRLSEGCAPGSTPGEETAGMEQRWLTSFIRSESVGSIPTPATLTTRGGTRVS